MPSTKDIEDFRASRNILAANIEIFHQGKHDMYRVVAVELRKLLCDGKNTLAPRIFPSVLMHPVRGNFLPKHLREGQVFHMPSVVFFDGKGGSRITELFDQKAEPIPLQDWLDQEFFSEKITIRELIRSVADKVSAHSDKDYNDTLELTRRIKLVGEDVHKQHIVAIGEYVLGIMTATMRQYPNVFGQLDA